MASAASGTNSSSTAFTSGTRTAAYREMVGCDVSRISPMNSCVAFCRRYMHAASTALYSPSDFGRPTCFFHGLSSASFTGFRMVEDALQCDGDGRRPGQGSLRPGDHLLHVAFGYPANGTDAQDRHVEPLRRGHVQAGEARQPVPCVCRCRLDARVAAEQPGPAHRVLIGWPGTPLLPPARGPRGELAPGALMPGAPNSPTPS